MPTHDLLANRGEQFPPKGKRAKVTDPLGRLHTENTPGFRRQPQRRETVAQIKSASMPGDISTRRLGPPTHKFPSQRPHVGELHFRLGSRVPLITSLTIHNQRTFFSRLRDHKNRRTGTEAKPRHSFRDGDNMLLVHQGRRHGTHSRCQTGLRYLHRSHSPERIPMDQ